MAQGTKNTRLDLRLRSEHKRLIEEAAHLSGQSISAFVAAAGVREAEQIVERFSNLRLSNRDRDAFLAALDNPPKPNAKLRKAFREHARKVIS